jgi:hypothetical protein
MDERERTRGESQPYREIEERREVRDERSGMILKGALWLGGGLALTIVTYSSAQGGGTYVLAWGPMIYGLITLVRGLAGSGEE